MAKYRLYNSQKDFLHVTALTLESAKKKCDEYPTDCVVRETYYDKCHWRPWDNKVYELSKEVYRNYKSDSEIYLDRQYLNDL